MHQLHNIRNDLMNMRRAIRTLEERISAYMDPSASAEDNRRTRILRMLARGPVASSILQHAVAGAEQTLRSLLDEGAISSHIGPKGGTRYTLPVHTVAEEPLS